MKLTRLLMGAALLALAAAGTAQAQGQQDLIKPINKELTFVYIPKVIHPWYDVVAQGAKVAAD